MKAGVVAACVAVALVLAGLVPAAAQQKRVTTKVCTLTVTGMSCAGCEAAVRTAARTVAGVMDVKVSFQKGRAEVTYDPTQTSPEMIAKAITERSGFRAGLDKQK